MSCHKSQVYRPFEAISRETNTLNIIYTGWTFSFMKWSPPIQKHALSLTLTFTVFYIVSTVTTIFLLTAKNAYSEIVVTPNKTPAVVSATPTPTPDPLAPFGVLLLGYRGDGSRGGTLTDTMLVAQVAPRQKKIYLISIPRDLWVSLESEKTIFHNFKINAAYAVGSDERNYPDKPDKYTGRAGGGVMAKEIVQKVTGLTIPYFVSVNFDAFTRTIDTLGGVDVQVSKSLDDPFFPITGEENNTCGKSQEEITALTATLSAQLLEESFPCRFEEVKVSPGVNHMDGTLALKFARSRHAKDDGSDFARSERQKEVILAARDKIFSVGFLSKIIPFIQSLAGSVQTDMTITDMQKFISNAQEYRGYTVSSIALSTKNVLKETYSNDRQYILVANSGEGDFTAIHEFLQEKMNPVVATPSANP